jgi:hypothetical protein
MTLVFHLQPFVFMLFEAIYDTPTATCQNHV